MGLKCAFVYSAAAKKWSKSACFARAGLGSKIESFLLRTGEASDRKLMFFSVSGVSVAGSAAAKKLSKSACFARAGVGSKIESFLLRTGEASDRKLAFFRFWAKIALLGRKKSRSKIYLLLAKNPIALP